jgi:hypothetical protein
VSSATHVPCMRRIWNEVARLGVFGVIFNLLHFFLHLIKHPLLLEAH